MGKITDNKYIRRVLKSEFIKSVFSIGSGNLIAQLISLVTVPILTRVYSNEAYGTYGVIASTVAIIVSFATLGLSSAIMAPKDDAESKKVLLTGICLQGVITVIIGVGACIVHPWYSLFTVEGSYYLAIAIMCIYVVVINMNSFLRVYVNRIGMNKILLVNPIIGSLCNFLIAIPLGLIGVGYVGFFIALIIGNAIMNVQMIVKSKPFEKTFRPSDIFRVIKEYKDFIIYQCPANLLSNAGTQWPVQYMSKLYDNAQMSYYTLACSVLQYPIRLIAAPIGTVYFRTASRYNREGRDLAGFTFKFTIGAMLLALLPMVIFVFWGGRICAFLLGDKWFETGKVAGIIILQYVLLFCTQCISYCRVSLGKQKANLMFGLISLLFTVVASFVGYKVFGSFLGTVIACTFARCVINVFDMALNFYYLKKYLKQYLLFSIPYLVGVFALIVINTI